MNTKLMMIIAILFFLFWRKATDGFFLFCALFATGLGICVLIYRMENPRTVAEEDEE